MARELGIHRETVRKYIHAERQPCRLSRATPATPPSDTGIVHIATGGCVLAECLACGKHWNLQGVPTHDTGPMLGLPRILTEPTGGA